MQILTNRFSPTQVNQTNTAEQVENKLSAYEQGKKIQDVAILTANTNGAADNPMKLLFKTAIEEINKILEPTLGKNATETAYDEDLDVSPEATANRIIDGTTAFYEGFKAQNSDLSDEEAINKFMEVISGGIDKGFEEAKDILDSLKVLEGDIETNIDSTYDFVQQGLTQFKELILERLAENSKEEPVAAEEITNQAIEE